MEQKNLEENLETLQWGNPEDQSASRQGSIETRLQELEMKETHVNNRLRELESKEKEMNLLLESLEHRERMIELKEKKTEGSVDFDSSLRSMVSMDGKRLLMFLNEYVGEQEKLHDGVYHALTMSEEPAILVLDAVKEFYSENGEVSLSGNVWKRSCVILLEQLTRLMPNIVPKVKADAARLAREWRIRIRMEDGQKGILEVLGFLLLLGAYGLVDEFDIGEMLSIFETIGQQHGQAGELGSAVALADKAPASVFVDSQVKVDRSLKEDMTELDNLIASLFPSPSDALKSFCVGMDGRSLRMFLYEHVEEHDSFCNEVCDALSHAPDPAKLVLDTIPGLLRSQPEFDKSLSLYKVRKSCILLLEQLLTISPQISHVREEALKMANEWGADLGEKFEIPTNVYGFLLFLAVYGFTSDYEADELFGLLEIAARYKPSPGLCQVLGLADKVEALIQTLIQKTLLLEAIENVYAYDLVGKFQPVLLLKDYLKKYSNKSIYKKGKKLPSQKAINKEIAVLRNVIKYIAKYQLESEYPPDDLEKQIVELEKKKLIKRTAKRKQQRANGKSKSTSFNSQGRVGPSLKENLQLANQMTSSSTSPWPQLESFCVSMDKRVLGVLSNEHMEGHDSESSSSSSSWTELKSFCVNMDGRSLRSFLYDHMEEYDSMRSEVWGALQYASDPAKLVLNAMPGFLRSQPEFDKSLSFSKVRKSCILLLEQLMNLSRVISPYVKEEALKMADEWRANLGQKYQNPVVAFGFLHLVAAYGLTSNYEADELLGLLETANQYEVSPGLCQILGLEDKIIGELIPNMFAYPKHLSRLLLEAIEHIYAFDVVAEFKPVCLLKDYMNYSKKRIYNKGSKYLSKQAIEKEIVVLRTVIKYINKYKLESEFPPEDLENQIVELEMQKLRCM